MRGVRILFRMMSLIAVIFFRVEMSLLLRLNYLYTIIVIVAPETEFQVSLQKESTTSRLHL